MICAVSAGLWWLLAGLPVQEHQECERQRLNFFVLFINETLRVPSSILQMESLLSVRIVRNRFEILVKTLSLQLTHLERNAV